MKSHKLLALSMGIVFFSGCGTRDVDSQNIASSVASSAGNENNAPYSKMARRREGKRRFANEVRVALVALPGDARVEIDGQVVERREGLVDLEGRVGDVRRVRVWKGDKATEKSVTIAENGAVPPLVDLNTPGPAETTSAPRKKASPVEFGFDE